MTEQDIENYTTREDIPLKSSKRSSYLCRCNEDILGGSKLINIAFASLTAIITIALLVQIYYGDYQVAPHGSVASDSFYCSEIGTSILKKGGNSVDAAIATTFCLAVTTPHVTGLEAEGQMIIYNHRTRSTPFVIDFTNLKRDPNFPKLVIGLGFCHKRYGSLPWKKLVEPSAVLAKEGFLISKLLAESVSLAKVEDLYGRLEPGQLLRLPQLADTLQHIANVSEKDLYNYIGNREEPIRGEAIKSQFYSYNIYVPTSPSIGPILSLLLKQIEKLNFTSVDVLKPEFMNQLVNITNTVYGDFRVFTKYLHGTASNVAVSDLHDNYVSFVSGMSSVFGLREMSLGYVLDEDTERSPAYVPMIITNADVVCGRRLILGGHDVATLAQIVTNLIILKQNASESIEAPRFHVLDDRSIGIEDAHAPFLNKELLQSLQRFSPNITLMREPYFSSNIVEKVADELSSHSDSRGGGIASRFK